VFVFGFLFYFCLGGFVVVCVLWGGGGGGGGGVIFWGHFFFEFIKHFDKHKKWILIQRPPT